nr:MAG TPA: hypothetical protein [Caudoviricetes sp.]
MRARVTSVPFFVMGFTSLHSIFEYISHAVHAQELLGRYSAPLSSVFKVPARVTPSRYLYLKRISNRSKPIF